MWVENLLQPVVKDNSVLFTSRPNGTLVMIEFLFLPTFVANGTFIIQKVYSTFDSQLFSDKQFQVKLFITKHLLLI